MADGGNRRPKRAAFVGECMMEFTGGHSACGGGDTDGKVWTAKPGGDVLNTAVYCKRLLDAHNVAADVDFFTALGDDAFSAEILQGMRKEGLGVSLVQRVAGTSCAVYYVHTNHRGERSFMYHGRSVSPAKRMFETAPDVSPLAQYDLVYFSGITLAILEDADRERLLSVLADVRARGGEVVLDTNYRPRLWRDGEASAREHMARAARLATLVLPSVDDERALFHDNEAGDVVARLVGAGAREVVVKQGDGPCVVATNNQASSPATFPNPFAVASPVDTTAAGDSFNAGYIAHRMFLGLDPAAAALAAHAVASHVVCHKGAIISNHSWQRSVMPVLAVQLKAKQEGPAWSGAGGGEGAGPSVLDMVKGTRVIPVLVFDSVEEAVPTAKALVKGGLRVLEVTLRTPAALDCIRAICANVPEAIVGVGTALTPSHLAQAKLAGAVFAVSPGSPLSMVQASRQLGMPWLPGVSTMTEAMTMMEFGFNFCKFFPAEANGGVATLKAWGGPLGGLKLCPTGGISPDNAEAYLALSNVACVGGSWLVSKARLKEGRWDEIEDAARHAAQLGARA